MKHPAHMYSTKQIADNCGQSHDDTKKMLSQLGFKPPREIKTGEKGRIYRYWHKDASRALVAHLEEKRKAKEVPAPVQEELPLEPEAPANATKKETIMSYSAEDMCRRGYVWNEARSWWEPKLPLEPEAPAQQEETPFKVPHPSLDITVMETKHAEDMLSILRSIDQRLYELTVIWSK